MILVEDKITVSLTSIESCVGVSYSTKDPVLSVCPKKNQSMEGYLLLDGTGNIVPMEGRSSYEEHFIMRIMTYEFPYINSLMKGMYEHIAEQRLRAKRQNDYDISAMRYTLCLQSKRRGEQE